MAIECSLDCAVESKRLIEQATRIREESKVLRQDSAALIRSKFITRSENDLPDYSNGKIGKHGS